MKQFSNLNSAMGVGYHLERNGASSPKGFNYKRLIGKFAATLIIAMCLTGNLWADNATQIADYINTTTYGDLTATVTGNTVTVTGTISGTPSTSDYLTLNIGAGVTVIWQASLTGSPSDRYALINISNGSGIFQMESGSIENTGTGDAIQNNSACAINISSGTVNAATGRAVFNGSTGVITVSGNAVFSAGNSAVYNASSGTVKISGGSISTTNKGSFYCTNAINNASTGTVEVSGGVVSAGCGNAIINYSGMVNISGGTVIATSGSAIYNNNPGMVNISDSAKITSSNTSSLSGTIVNYNNIFSNSAININGGTVENTSSGSAIYTFFGTVNVNDGMVQAQSGSATYTDAGTFVGSTVNISGGKVEATNGYAIYNSYSAKINISGGTISTSGSSKSAVYISTVNTNIKIIGGTVSVTQSNSYAVYVISSTTLTLGGDPTIAGRIFSYPEVLSVLTDGADAFVPGQKIYTLDFPAAQYAAGNIAVMNGRNFFGNFKLYNTDWHLVQSGAHLAMAAGSAGIADVQSNSGSLTVYPNPTKDDIIIENGELKMENVEICDLSGRKMLNYQLSTVNYPLKINVSALPQGVYLLRVHTGKGVAVSKVVKE